MKTAAILLAAALAGACPAATPDVSVPGAGIGKAPVTPDGDVTAFPEAGVSLPYHLLPWDAAGRPMTGAGIRPGAAEHAPVGGAAPSGVRMPATALPVTRLRSAGARGRAARRGAQRRSSATKS